MGMARRATLPADAAGLRRVALRLEAAARAAAGAAVFVLAGQDLAERVEFKIVGDAVFLVLRGGLATERVEGEEAGVRVGGGCLVAVGGARIFGSGLRKPN